jgi:hypothetical protein
MAKPFDRIYFDSNELIASAWPYPRLQKPGLFWLSAKLGIDLYLPDPTELELEAHWIRKYEAHCTEITTRVEKFNKHIRRVIAEPVKITLTDRDPARAAYRAHVENLKTSYSLKKAPLHVPIV